LQENKSMRPHAFRGSKETGREYGVGFFQFTWKLDATGNRYGKFQYKSGDSRAVPYRATSYGSIIMKEPLVSVLK